MDQFHAKLSGGRIPGLDGIRTVAVFLVILFHFGFKNINGALGVEMFFTLSGFLITWLLLKEVERTGTVSFKKFYKRRTLRIFPAFYAYLLFGLVVHFVRGHEIPWRSVVASSLYLQNYNLALIRSPDDFLSHAWSLGIEEQFYLLWPAVVYKLGYDLRRLNRFLIAVIGLTWIHRGLLYFVFDVWSGYLYCAFDTRMDQLAVGCLLAVSVQRRALGGLWRWATSHWYLSVLTMLLLAASAGFHQTHAYRYTVAYAVEPILTAVLIVQVVSLSEAGVCRVFNWGPMSYLGRISYSLYLYQELTLFTARRLAAGLPLVVQFGFAVAVTVGFAMASFYLIEQRFRVVRPVISRLVEIASRDARSEQRRRQVKPRP